MSIEQTMASGIEQFPLPVGESDNAMYDEISIINNELITLQRELAMKNAELVRTNEEIKRLNQDLDLHLKEKTEQLVLANQLLETESRLKASQQVYRQLVEQIPEVIYTDEIGGNWLYISPNIHRLCGYTDENLTAEPGLWLDLILPADRDRLVSEIHSFPVGDEFNLEYQIQTRDRGLIWVRDHGVIKEDPSTGRKLAQGLLAETTKQKAVEEALRKSEERFKQLAEIFPETIFEADLSGRLTYINAQAFQSFGVTQSDI